MTDSSKINYDYTDEESENLGSEVSQCMSCRHRDSQNPMKCTAFPDGIPMLIFSNGYDHRMPFPGDHNIQWFPRDKTAINPIPLDDFASQS